MNLNISDNAGALKITAEKHILCYLWFVGHESGSYRDVADRFGITISALHKVITRVTDFIMLLTPEIIRYPTIEEKEICAAFFQEEKGFPRIIGNVISNCVVWIYIWLCICLVIFIIESY